MMFFLTKTSAVVPTPVVPSPQLVVALTSEDIISERLDKEREAPLSENPLWVGSDYSDEIIPGGTDDDQSQGDDPSQERQDQFCERSTIQFYSEIGAPDVRNIPSEWVNLFHRKELDISVSELDESQAELDELSIEERYVRLKSIQDPEESLNAWREIRNEELTIQAVNRYEVFLENQAPSTTNSSRVSPNIRANVGQKPYHTNSEEDLAHSYSAATIERMSK